MEQSAKISPPAWLRWLVLFIVSLAMMGNYYIYDSISPLADLLKQQLGFSDTAIGTLNAIYSLPNIIMVLIGGVIIDRIGIRKAGFIFAFLIMIGALLTCISGKLSVMATGRLIFGLGAESMIVAITTSIARWFKDKEFALAFGLNLTIARLGSFMALNSPSWARELYQMGWQYPLIISAVAGSMALLCISLYSIVDYLAEKRYQLPKEGNTDKIEIKKIFQFPVSFWFISLLCVVFYSAMFPFQTFAVKFFQHVHHTTRDAGGLLSSLLTLSAMVFTPIFGALSDKIGRRATLMLAGSLLIIPVYLLMGYGVNLSGWLGLPESLHIKFALLKIDSVLPTNLFIPMAMMGLAFSLVPAVMWPSVAYVVDATKLGTAYGLMTLIQNVGLFSFNLLIGAVNDIFAAGPTNPNGYLPGMWIFSACGVFGMVFALLLRKYAPALEKGVKQ
ncbi:MAG: MFS transporter [Bacteroidales bacterium]